MEFGSKDWFDVLLKSADRALPKRIGATAQLEITFLPSAKSREEFTIHIHFIDGRIVDAGRGPAAAPDISLLVPESAQTQLLVGEYALADAVMNGTVVADGSMEKLMVVASVVTAPEYGVVRKDLLAALEN